MRKTRDNELPFAEARGKQEGGRAAIERPMIPSRTSFDQSPASRSGSSPMIHLDLVQMNFDLTDC